MAPPEGNEKEDEIQIAKRAITTAKKNVTRHINYVGAHIENESPEIPSNQTKAKLLVDQLDSSVEKFQKCIDALDRLGIDPEDDVERYEQRWIQIKVDYSNWTSKIPTPTGSGSGRVIIGRNFNIRKEIPKFFSGEKENRQYYRTWRMKWDEASKEMTALGYSKAKQLCELKMVVEGEALRWIEGLPEDGDNLDAALHLLEEHYKSNMRDVVDILKDLYKATEMVPTKESLTHGLQVVLLARQALTGTRLTPLEICDLHLMILAEKLLYPRLDREWEDIKDANKDPDKAMGTRAGLDDWEELMRLELKKVTKLQEKKETMKKEIEKNKPEQKQKKEEKKHGGNGGTLPGGFSSQRQDQKPKPGRGSSTKRCVGCKKDGHYLLQCYDFTKNIKSGKERRQFLKEKDIKICRNCLKFNHRTEECQIKDTCNCGIGGHHRLLHEDRHQKSSAPAQRKEAEPDQTDDIKMSYPVRTFDAKKNPILQSCLAQLLGAGGEKLIARVFLDPGSEITMIRRQFAQQAGLVGKDTTLQMTVAGGGVTSESKEKEVMIQLQSMDGTYTSPKIVATTSKIITRDLRAVDVATDKYSHLKGVKFTEAYPRKEVQVDILLGCDDYTSLITGEVIRGNPKEPVAIATKLGYVLASSA